MDDDELLAKAEAGPDRDQGRPGTLGAARGGAGRVAHPAEGKRRKSLEEMLEAADDAEPDRLAESTAKAESKRKPPLDDLLTKDPKKKNDWPS